MWGSALPSTAEPRRLDAPHRAGLGLDVTAGREKTGAPANSGAIVAL